jgi:hypothetical protein
MLKVYFDTLWIINFQGRYKFLNQDGLIKMPVLKEIFKSIKYRFIYPVRINEMGIK